MVGWEGWFNIFTPSSRMKYVHDSSDCGMDRGMQGKMDGWICSFTLSCVHRILVHEICVCDCGLGMDGWSVVGRELGMV